MNMLGMLFGIEARRPASWLLFFAAIGGGSIAGSGRVLEVPPAAIGFVLGGILAVAALGARAPAPAGHLGGESLAMVARIGWPVIGGVVGALASAAGPSFPALTGILLGIAFAATLSVVFQREMTNRADVASSALLVTAGVGWAGTWGWTSFPHHFLARCVALLAAVVVTLGTAAIVARIPLAARKPRGTGRLLASGEPARGRLDLVGMLVALTSMVFCLFLAPESAAANVVVTLACFVALAVPEATISPVALGQGWKRLLGTVALRPVRGGGRFGMTDLVTETIGFHALMLGWPSLVALALSVGDERRSAEALLTVAALAGIAAVTWGVASLVRHSADGGTTQTAVIAALVVVWMVVVSFLPSIGPNRPHPGQTAVPLKASGGAPAG